MTAGTIIQEKIKNGEGEPTIRKWLKGGFLGKGGFAKVYEFTNYDTSKSYNTKLSWNLKLQLIGIIKNVLLLQNNLEAFNWRLINHFLIIMWM